MRKREDGDIEVEEVTSKNGKEEKKFYIQGKEDEE